MNTKFFRAPALLAVIIITVGAILTHTLTPLGITFLDVVIVSLAFLFVTILSLVVAHWKADDLKKSNILLFVSFGCKFIGELALALVWFLFLKKIELSSLFLFFLIYLGFTMIWVFSILKSLKIRQ